jgi:hypothetical protein
MCPGREILMHYFSCSGRPSAVPIKPAMGNVMLNLCFCIRCDMWVTWRIPLCPGRETSPQYFSCLGGPDFHKKYVGSHYTDLVFLHLMGYAGHIMHSGGSGCKTSMHYFHAWVGQCGFPKKGTGTRYAKLVIFKNSGNCGSRHVFQYVRGVKHRRTTFDAQGVLVRSP